MSSANSDKPSGTNCLVLPRHSLELDLVASLYLKINKKFEHYNDTCYLNVFLLACKIYQGVLLTPVTVFKLQKYPFYSKMN